MMMEASRIKAKIEFESAIQSAYVFIQPGGEFSHFLIGREGGK